VECPRCRIQISGKNCPQCGIEITPIKTEALEAAATRSPTRRESKTPDWRLQIKHKVVQHTEKKDKKDRVGREVPQKKNIETERKRPLFDYSLGDSAQGLKEQRVVTFARSTPESQQVVEKPLIRTPVASRAGPRSHLPKQQALTLEAPAALEDPSVSTSEEEAAGEIGLSHEVLFSRMLAGIIDLFLPVLIAVVFSFSAAKILNFDFFSADSLRLGILVALSFFFLNSFFFLILSGQTPGMYLTDLQLVGEESETVPFQSLVIRICLFLPVVATVVGLLWSIFDPWCRGAHDRVSGTRVVPITHSSSGEISTSSRN
jgi:uncharacterized RDD family membrane protein YckC